MEGLGRSIEQMVLCAEPLINANTKLLQLLLLIPAVRDNTTTNFEVPTSKEELKELLVTRHALPSKYSNTPVEIKIQKIINRSYAGLEEIEDKEQNAKAVWNKLKQTHSTIMGISFIETGFSKHLQSSVITNKQLLLQKTFMIITELTHKYLIPVPSPYAHAPPAKRKILNITHWRISPEVKSILDHYWDMHLRADGKSYLPKTCYPELEQLTGLPKQTIMISFNYFFLFIFFISMVLFDIPDNYFQNNRNRKGTAIGEEIAKVKGEITTLKTVELALVSKLKDINQYPLFSPSPLPLSLSSLPSFIFTYQIIF